MSRPALTLDQLEQLMTKLPFNHHLGLRVTRRHADGVTIECPVLPIYGNIHGTLHGGVTATLVDVAAGVGVLSQFGTERLATTVELKLNYLAPVAGKKVTARSRMLRGGKTLCVFDVRVHNDKRELAAAALVTYMLISPKSA